MDDESKRKNMETNIFGEFGSKISDVGDVFQSLWVRRGSILPYYYHRKFILRKFNFVLYFGIILWVIFYLSKIF